MGKLGLSQCLTPSGVNYVPRRGGPLVGEELLLLQGIPADDLLLTRESDKMLKDLAGNAMTTTVVGGEFTNAVRNMNGNIFCLFINLILCYMYAGFLLQRFFYYLSTDSCSLYLECPYSRSPSSCQREVDQKCG